MRSFDLVNEFQLFDYLLGDWRPNPLRIQKYWILNKILNRFENI